MNEKDLYWLAGIFEGEGSFCINKHGGRGSGSIYASISMTDKDVVDRIDRIFPGKRYERDKSDKGWKTLYVWQVNGIRAYEFICQVYDILGQRRKSKADELISVWNSPTANHNIRATRVSQIALLLEQGYNNRMISKELDISESYVGQLRKDLL